MIPLHHVPLRYQCAHGAILPSVLNGIKLHSETIAKQNKFPLKTGGAEGVAFPLGFGYNGPVDKALVFGTEDCKFGSARVIF